MEIKYLILGNKTVDVENKNINNRCRRRINNLHHYFFPTSSLEVKAAHHHRFLKNSNFLAT